MLPDLFKTLEGRERSQQQAIISFLSDVKDTDAIEAFVTYLQEETNPENRKLVLSAIWNSKLPFDEHLPFFVMLASQGDYLEALEQNEGIDADLLIDND